MQAYKPCKRPGRIAGAGIQSGESVLRGYVSGDGACGDGMPFVQTPLSEASCECET